MSFSHEELKSEEWRPVVGYEGWYEVSDQGRVRRIKPGQGVGRLRVLRAATNARRRGYVFVLLSRGEAAGRGRKNRYVHRLVAEAFLGARMPGMQVNHIDGDKRNNRATNLEYVTRRQNHDHAVRLGLRPFGSRLGHAKLSEESVSLIRTELADVSERTVGEMLGVSQSTVNRAKHAKHWKHVAVRIGSTG